MRASSILLSTILCTSSAVMVGGFLSSPLGAAFVDGGHSCARGPAHHRDQGADGERELDERPSLEGKVLIAAHDLDDPYFAGSLIYLLADDEGGSLGVVLNRPRHAAAPGVMIWEGGPVGRDRVFVLHDDVEHQGSVVIGDVAVAADPKILNDVLEGGGPAHAKVFVGYAGWGPRQLDAELAAGAWLVADPAPGMLLH